MGQHNLFKIFANSLPVLLLLVPIWQPDPLLHIYATFGLHFVLLLNLALAFHEMCLLHLG